MHIQIITQDGTPIYQQIVNQVKYLVASARLKPGDEIPPIRTLAEQLTINPNTVARAYLELERSGVVYKRHGMGTYVSEGRPPPGRRRDRTKTLTNCADKLLTEALCAGIDFDELIEILGERNQALQAQAAK
jgi:GntR family transcriptional regulator